MQISFEEKRKIIIDNFSTSNNLTEEKIFDLEKLIKKKVKKFTGEDKNCGDEIYLLIEINNKLIKNFFFSAKKSCILVISLANILINYMKWNNISLAKKILRNFELMIKEKKYELKNFEKLEVFNNINKFPGRVKCILLVINSIKKTLNKERN